MSMWKYLGLGAGFLAFGALGTAAAHLDPALGPTVVVCVGMLLGIAWPHPQTRHSYAVRLRRLAPGQARGAHRRQVEASPSSRSLAG
jgi:hypothetical protein